MTSACQNICMPATCRLASASRAHIACHVPSWNAPTCSSSRRDRLPVCRWLISNRGFPVDQIASGPLQFFIFSVTIVVVAVPEGLPLAVTISLASPPSALAYVIVLCLVFAGAGASCS